LKKWEGGWSPGACVVAIFTLLKFGEFIIVVPMAKLQGGTLFEL